MEMRIERPDGSLCDPHEVGEIVGRGPMTMPGYYKRPDLTANAIRNGWLYSGDLGYLDEDGYPLPRGSSKRYDHFWRCQRLSTGH